MDCETNTTINGNIVLEIGQFAGIQVFELDSRNDDEKTLYFVKGKKVIKKMYISASCSQNVGYIDSFELTDVE